MNYEDLKYLSVPLPEDILKEKWSGNLGQVRKLIACRVEDKGMTEPLRKRLELELSILDHMVQRYTVSREEGLKMVQEEFPNLTEEDFDRLQLENKMDWIYLDGKVMYLNNFCRNLKKVYPELAQLHKKPEEIKAPEKEKWVKPEVKDGEEISAHIHLRHELRLAPSAVKEGKNLHVHIPLPVERDQIKNLKILSVNPSPVKLPDMTEEQPTVYFEEKAAQGQVFSVEYEFDHVTTYHDLERVDLKAVSDAAENLPEEVKPYLREELPHIAFTPYLRALAAELQGEEKNPLLVAHRFYDYITQKVDYRFVRDYASFDNISQYCAVNQRGDCGVQALLFITLCRIAGIPAKWQSGLCADPGSIGEHDWARFYVPSIGWVYADPSYGGGARRQGEEEKRKFYFGNTDPYRIPINDDFQRDLVPAKKFMRDDPYDNQRGEVEYEDGGIYGKDYQRTFVEIDIHG
jgi:transglutaminase-like putative cysteine protease